MRKLRYEVWSAAVSLLEGNDAVSSGSVRWPVWLVPLIIGRPAAVRRHHRAEGKTGIHSILAHPKLTHTYDRLTPQNIVDIV